MYQKFPFSAVISLILFFLSLNSFGQVSRVDSLKRELQRSRTSNILWELAFELFDANPSEALKYGRQAFDEAISQNDTTQIIRSGRITGQILRRADKLDESIEILTTVLPLSEKKQFNKETKYILNALAIAYSLKAQYDKALEYHFRGLVMRQKDGDKKQISISLNNIGWIYYRLGTVDLALDYYLQSLKAKEEVQDTFDKDRLYINIGLCYNSLGDYDRSKEYFNKAFELCGEECDNEILMEGEYGLANALFQQKKYNEAEVHFKKSLALSKLEKNQRFEAENLIDLGRMSFILNDFTSVLNYIREIEAIPEIQYGENLLDLNRLRADYYTKIGDFEKANLYQRKYSSLKDSIYAEDVLKNLNKVQTQFAQRENLAIIASKDEVLKLNHAIITQQRVLNWLLVAIVILTSVLGIVIYQNYKRTRMVNGALASAKQVIEDQNQLLDHQVQRKTRELVETNEQLVKVNDELDNFIYKTSHDIRGPLASLKGMVNLAIMDVKDEKALTYLSKLDLTAEKLNTVLTRLLIVNRINHTELKPEVIHFEPIIQEILTLEMKKGVSDKIKIDYEVSSDVRLISDHEMVRLILENLIDNAIKFHDESERVESFVKVLVQQEEGHVVAHIIDNGTGIGAVSREHLFQMFVRASERSETGGIGLYLAKLATEKLGGDINLVSTDEQITQFTVVFPNDLHEIIDRRKEEKRRLDQEKARMEEKRAVF